MEDLQDKIIELMDLFDGEVTTADKIDRPERALEKEAIDDFMKRNPMAGGGMLVQPGADGSRPGYKDDNLPDFITKTPYDTYRVRSKKTKSNPKINASFKTLKEAKAFVKEKNLVKSKTGVEYPELVAKAQSVVDDYNKIVESAVKKNDLRNVKFFEGYVKDRFKKTSDQNQILRQVYKKKLNYTDLTQIKKSVAKNLITEVMDMETIVPNNYIYDRLGGFTSLTSDTRKIVSNGLKNQTKIKVDNAIAAIVEADEIIDSSLMDTVAERIGRTQFGTAKDTAWKTAFKNNPYYKKRKKLLDYAFSGGAKRNRAVGMSLSEILDDAKYKIGGGVTFSGKQTQFSGLRRYIFDYAKSHWHRNNFDGNPEKSLIEFYDKNGKPIKWKSGLKLKIGEVQFKIPSESNIMWSYGGGPKGSVSVTGKIADASGIFREVTETYNIMKDISDAEVTDPISGKKTNYNDLVSRIYKQGYGYTGTNIFGLDMDHFKGVKEHPFKNLRAMDRKLNISLGAIDRTFDNRNLKAKLKNEMLGELATKKGGAYNTALKNYFVNQATNVLDKGIAPTLATESPYYSAVKNVYEQKNLPKVQKELLEKSYQRATKLEQTLLNNLQANSKLDECRLDSAEGGRIGFKFSTKCITDGLNETKKKAAAGDKKAARQLVETAEVATKGRLLKNVIGPGAILGEALFEGALIGNRLLEGKPLKQAWAESYLSYLDPRKYSGELDPTLLQREQMLESTADKDILRSGFAAQDQLSAFNKALQDRELAKARGRTDQYNVAAADAREQGRFADQSADIISSEAFKDASNIAQEYIQGQQGQRMFPYNQFKQSIGRFESGEDRDYRRRKEQEMKNLYTQYSDDEIRSFLKQSLGTDDDALIDKYLDLTGVTKRITPAVTTTLSGLDVLRTGLQEQEALNRIAEAGGVANLAGGGIAKMAGVPSGPPPESGPNPQGLQGLMKRVKNI